MNMWQKIWRSKVPVFFLLAICLRLFALSFPAHPYDIGTYQAWGSMMLDQGPVRFFQTSWCDYLPLPIFFLSGVTILTHLVQLPFSLVFRGVISLIELLLIFGIYKNFTHPKRNFALALLLFSPALISDSAFWGQLDTIPALLTLFALVLLNQSFSLKTTYNKLLTMCLPALLFGVALAFKPIMILVAPVFIILSYKRFKLLLTSVAVSLFTFILSAWPASPGFSVFSFLLNKMVEQGSTYPYKTINAFNFWQIGNPLNLWGPDNASLLGISAHNFSLFLFFILVFLSLWQWRKRQFDSRYSYRLAGMLLIFFFTFTTRMHERHLLFGLPFLALAGIYETQLLVPLLLFTFYFLLNLFAAYYWVIHNQSWPISYMTSQLVSWGVVLTSISLLVWDWQAFLKNLIHKIKSNRYLIILIIFATTLRLINLGNPPGYIFDEVYHAFTARELLHNHVEAWEWWTTPPPGVAYEWTHPPLAKYGMMTGMIIFGENAFGWRFGSVVAGVLSILGIFYLVRSLFKNPSVAYLTAFLLSIEGLHLVQSRIGMNDTYMLAFYVWALFMAVKSRWKLAGVLYGLALASKWSALYGLAPLALVYLHDHKIDLNFFLNALRLMLIAVLIYLICFIPFILAGHTIAELIELHHQMWYYHTHLVATHAYQSQPWQWVLALRPVWYYVNYGDKVSNIYAQANPLILWLGLVAFIMQLPRLKSFSYLLLYTCYLSLFLPWIFSPRIMFFYHYLPSAVFLVVILASWLAEFPRKYIFPVLTLCLLCFILLSPLYYGTPMAKTYWDTLFTIFPSWK